MIRTVLTRAAGYGTPAVFTAEHPGSARGYRGGETGYPFRLAMTAEIRGGLGVSSELDRLYRDIITGVGEDPGREGLQDTPQRAARAMQYLTRGYSQTVEEVVNNAIFESDNDEMILVKDIELYSLCEHHLLPFIGKCHVAYIPTGRVIGLSKVARIVDMFARRLQIQENLTKQIADTLMAAIRPAGVGVIIEAQHLCMMMRGVEKQNSMMTTSMMLGSFRDHDRTRSEFLKLVRN
jgi:GTP cyclohydrolase I